MRGEEGGRKEEASDNCKPGKEGETSNSPRKRHILSSFAIRMHKTISSKMESFYSPRNNFVSRYFVENLASQVGREVKNCGRPPSCLPPA